MKINLDAALQALENEFPNDHAHCVEVKLFDYHNDKDPELKWRLYFNDGKNLAALGEGKSYDEALEALRKNYKPQDRFIEE